MSFSLFLYNIACMLSHFSHADSLWPYGLWPTRLPCPWDSPGKDTGVSCHVLLQRIFPIQGSNLSLWHLLHWQPPGKPYNITYLPSKTHLRPRSFFNPGGLQFMGSQRVRHNWTDWAGMQGSNYHHIAINTVLVCVSRVTKKVKWTARWWLIYGESHSTIRTLRWIPSWESAATYKTAQCSRKDQELGVMRRSWSILHCFQLWGLGQFTLSVSSAIKWGW